MFYFIVSGYIPGTDFQVTFDMIIFIAAGLLVSIGLLVLIRNTIRDTRNLIVSLRNNIEEIAL